ncbi:trehalose-phosphatase [Roseomonas rosulenta]|uniref:trehalose-phosphatase n=1 Tax=Roseomonas rosulenta TaxID=2748667 RepID=UPI0018E04996|nr:trehalose-phosphatase [Roseomonas rosulenta]
MTTSRVPAIERDWALFLDLDGTLLDIAPTPDAVVVPDGLVATLQDLSGRLDGAVALVTGRARAVADSLLAPLTLPGGFGHAAELRGAAGRIGGDDDIPPLPAEWAERLAQQVADWRDVILEVKPHGLALHYRAGPQHREEIRDTLVALLRGREDDFALLPAHMAFEIRPRAATKARAVRALMRSAPFLGRRPVFIGDDVTDEDGMAAARDLGGLGLHVGRDFRGGPQEVRAWLAQGIRHAAP